MSRKRIARGTSVYKDSAKGDDTAYREGFCVGGCCLIRPKVQPIHDEEAKAVTEAVVENILGKGATVMAHRNFDVDVRIDLKRVATVVAALRFFPIHYNSAVAAMSEWHFEDLPPLTEDEIGNLCDHIMGCTLTAFNEQNYVPVNRA